AQSKSAMSIRLGSIARRSMPRAPVPLLNPPVRPARRSSTCAACRASKEMPSMAGENGITKVHSVGALKSAIGEHWKHFPAAAVALQIIEAIEAEHSPAQKWHTSDILILLDQSQLTADVVAALAILTQSEYAVFRAAAEFVDVDQQRYL